MPKNILYSWVSVTTMVSDLFQNSTKIFIQLQQTHSYSTNMFIQLQQTYSHSTNIFIQLQQTHSYSTNIYIHSTSTKYLFNNHVTTDHARTPNPARQKPDYEG